MAPATTMGVMTRTHTASWASKLSHFRGGKRLRCFCMRSRTNDGKSHNPPLTSLVSRGRIYRCCILRRSRHQNKHRSKCFPISRGYEIHLIFQRRKEGTSCNSRIWYVAYSSNNSESSNQPFLFFPGWAGYTFARSLDPNKYERVIISPRSYFVFTPLLASTAVGTLEFRTTLEPVRRLGRNKAVQFHQGWADDIDFVRKVIRVEENRADHLSSQTILPPSRNEVEHGKGGRGSVKGAMTDVPYDKLIVAVGAYSQTFGIEGVREHAHFLRDIGDARRIRLRVLSLFEQCTSPSIDDDTRRRLLHFAIVGGGPTGIEYAAELHDLIHDDLARIYPALMPHVAITVYDIAPKILPMFDQVLADYAMGMFSRQRITVKTGHSIQRIRPDPKGAGGLSLKIQDEDGEVGAGMVVWSTGLMQNPLVEKLVGKSLSGVLPVEGREAPAEYRLEKDPKTGGIITDDRLRARLVNADRSSSELPTQRLHDVFVIGDCAVINNQPNLPKTAQVASQQAAYLGRALNKGTLEDRPFKFRNLGTMTYLGNWKAIHQSSADHLTGRAAWVLWRTAYLTRSISLRNKVLLPVYVSTSLPPCLHQTADHAYLPTKWFVSWVFGRDISGF